MVNLADAALSDSIIASTSFIGSVPIKDILKILTELEINLLKNRILMRLLSLVDGIGIHNIFSISNFLSLYAKQEGQSKDCKN